MRRSSNTGKAAGLDAPLPAAMPLFRKPRRITITLADQPYRLLLERSLQEGRSLSNLAAYLLERATAPAEAGSLPLGASARHCA